MLIDGCLSRLKSVISGVPQRSVLGPLLFVIFINDLVEILPQNIVVKLFADDVKLYSEINCDANLSDMHDCISKLVKWANLWQLKVSVSKCCTLDLFLNKRLMLTKHSFIDDTALERAVKQRDLGVIIDQKLNFSEHISSIVIHAKQRMSLLLKCFSIKDSYHLMAGFKSFIIPLVEYCSPVWSPHLVRDIMLIESVQRVFTKRIPGLSDKSYLQRIALLGIKTLERRRLEQDLLTCYKILHGLVCGPPESYGLFLSNRKSRGHSLKLVIEQPKLDVRKYFVLQEFRNHGTRCLRN